MAFRPSLPTPPPPHPRHLICLQSQVPDFCIPGCSPLFTHPYPSSWPKEFNPFVITLWNSVRGVFQPMTTAWAIWLTSTKSPMENNKCLPSVHAGHWECTHGSFWYCFHFYISWPPPKLVPVLSRSKYFLWPGLSSSSLVCVPEAISSPLHILGTHSSLPNSLCSCSLSLSFKESDFPWFSCSVPVSLLENSSQSDSLQTFLPFQVEVVC